MAQQPRKPTTTHKNKPARTTAKLKPAQKTVTVEPAKVTNTSVEAASVSQPKLRKWNFALAALHAVQGIAILLLSTGKGFPISTGFTAQDPLQTAAQGKPVLTIGYHHLFDINLAYLVAGFFFISALAHLSIATWYRARYVKGLAQGRNRLRWIEYALSASVMILAIGLLTGMQDISLLLLLFAGTAVMNLCGLIMETHNVQGEKVKWLSYWVGSIAGLFPWIAVAIYLVGSNVYGGSVPTFVYWIFGSIFLFFTSFAVNMVLQYRRIGKWADYIYGERVYMILSLVAKSLLAWQVFAGALKP